MSIVLSQAGYGKSEIRLVKVSRRAGGHDLRDLTVDVGLEGDFDAAYTAGDNAGLLATDTMRNTVYALAKQYPIDPIESFAQRLADHPVAGAVLARPGGRRPERPRSGAAILRPGRPLPDDLLRSAGRRPRREHRDRPWA